MSQMIEKLKQINQSPEGKKIVSLKASLYDKLIEKPPVPEAPVPPSQSTASAQGSSNASSVPRVFFWSLLMAWAATLILAAIFISFGMHSRKSLAQELMQLQTEQAQAVKTLTAQMESFVGEQKETARSLETKFNVVNTRLIKAEQRLDDMESVSSKNSLRLADREGEASELRGQMKGIQSELEGLKGKINAASAP